MLLMQGLAITSQCVAAQIRLNFLVPMLLVMLLIAIVLAKSFDKSRDVSYQCIIFVAY